MLAFTKNIQTTQSQGLYLLHQDKNHQVWAGKNARELILANGLSPDMVSTVTGSAGGSKTLCLAGLDQLLFGQWLKESKTEKMYIGASAGSWRMAACMTNDPAKSLGEIAFNLADGCGYDPCWKSERLEAGFREIIESGIKGKEHEIMSSKDSFSILVAKTTEKLYLQGKYNKAGIVNMLVQNAVKREHLGKFLNRVFVSNKQAIESISQIKDGIRSEIVELSAESLIDWLFCSATLPGYFPGKPHEQGRSMLLDGGLIDIDLSYPNLAKDNSIHLFPHFHPFVRLGWLDKIKMPTGQARLAPQENLKHTLLICPTDHFVSSLPGKKLPCRKDLKSYGNNNALRFSHWTACKDQSFVIADEFQRFLSRFEQ